MSLENGQMPPSRLRVLPGFAPYPGGPNFLPVSSTTLSDLVLPGVLVDAENMAAAFARDLNEELTYAEAYRSRGMQEQRKREQAAGGPTAAYPGTSNHGWGQAIDYRNGIGYADTATYQWMRDNAGKYGFIEDVPGEHWHWHHPSTTALTAPTIEGAGTGTTTPLEEDDMFTDEDRKMLKATYAASAAARSNSNLARGYAFTIRKELRLFIANIGVLVWGFKLTKTLGRSFSASLALRTLLSNTDSDKDK